MANRAAEVVDKLRSLEEGHRALVEVVAYGSGAVPALRALLLEREPDGLFQPRCLAVAALAALQAYGVLIEYLSTLRARRDPVEQVGDDAVINATARALADRREEHVFELLLSLAEARLRPGVIEALGTFRRAEALPYFVAALADDDSRPAAEAALRNLGAAASQALMTVATFPAAEEHEGDSRLRQRRSALRQLTEIGIGRQAWPVLRHVMMDRDPILRMLACRLCLAAAPQSEKAKAVRQLIAFMDKADWLLLPEIQDCLTTYFDDAQEAIEAALRDDAPDDTPLRKRTLLALRHVKALATARAASGTPHRE
ncbi:MAG: HEAT repeat domain-containing protein [Methylovirgula sp.]